MSAFQRIGYVVGGIFVVFLFLCQACRPVEKGDVGEKRPSSDTGLWQDYPQSMPEFFRTSGRRFEPFPIDPADFNAESVLRSENWRTVRKNEKKIAKPKPIAGADTVFDAGMIGYRENPAYQKLDYSGGRESETDVCFIES